jgi:hypothetical protein
MNRRLRYHCDICGERIGMWSEFDHKMKAHPEVMAIQGSNRMRYAVWYFPAITAAIGLMVGSALLHESWWWRLGVLGGIYAMFAILIVFGVKSWRRERPFRLQVSTACMVCGAQMQVKDVESHMSTEHPDVFRAVKRTAWLMTPTLLGFLVYLLALIGLLVFNVLPAVRTLYLALVFVPLFTWMAIIAVVGFVLGKRYLKHAYMQQ